MDDRIDAIDSSRCLDTRRNGSLFLIRDQSNDRTRPSSGVHQSNWFMNGATIASSTDLEVIRAGRSKAQGTSMAMARRISSGATPMGMWLLGL